MSTIVNTLVLACTIGYLVASAVLALATAGRPRRAFDLRTSIALAVARTLLAVGLAAVLLEVLGS